MKEIADILRAWKFAQKRGLPCALATLVGVRGSSYRRPGARMLISADGTAVGSLSGGCLEEEVAAAAREVMQSGEPALMEFDTRRRFGCNGTIQIFIEAVRDEFLAGLSERLWDRRTCHALTVYTGEPSELGSRLLEGGASAARAGVFTQIIEPPLRLILFGDGPDSAALRTFATTLGWDVIEIESAAELPAQADARTAAIVKSHNYGRDCAALRTLLQLGLRYVALLGPRRRRDELLGDLLDSGTTLSSELFAPAGLDIGAETPEEIALAIIAEIQTVFADASGESLRDRKAPIHGWNLARPAAAATEPCATSAQ